MFYGDEAEIPESVRGMLVEKHGKAVTERFSKIEWELSAAVMCFDCCFESGKRVTRAQTE